MPLISNLATITFMMMNALKLRGELELEIDYHIQQCPGKSHFTQSNDVQSKNSIYPSSLIPNTASYSAYSVHLASRVHLRFIKFHNQHRTIENNGDKACPSTSILRNTKAVAGLQKDVGTELTEDSLLESSLMESQL